MSSGGITVVQPASSLSAPFSRALLEASLQNDANWLICVGCGVGWGEDDEGEGEGEGASAPRRRRRDGHSAEDKPPADDVGVQILLLDGEEAFVSWTATDSLYGARYV